MSRLLFEREKAIIGLLLSVNHSDGCSVESLLTQVDEAEVDEIDSPFFLGFRHSEEVEAPSDVHRLSAELVAIDEGVPVLIYATIVEGSGGGGIGYLCRR